MPSKRSSILLFLIIFLLTITTAITSQAGPSLASRLSGKILLQVEDRGQAWYISPNHHNHRIHLGSPEEAYCLMRTLGLGISNKDLNKYFNNTINRFPNRLAGKILLAVEQHGEAYYINPDNLQGYYLGRPNDAYAIMKKLSLGITNANLQTIPILDNTQLLKQCNLKPTQSLDVSNITNISLTTHSVNPMTNFTHIVAISTTISNPQNIPIKEQGLLYDFTIFPNTKLTPTLDNYQQKIISDSSVNINNTYTLNITNLIPSSYPYIRTYVITTDNQIIYGNTITISSINTINLPPLPTSSAMPEYTVKYLTSNGGTITGNNTQIIRHGQNGTPITVTPDTGYTFTQWSDGSTDNPRTDTNVTKTTVVEAFFTLNTYTLTYTAGSGGTITGSSSQAVNYGASGTAVTAVANEDHEFTQWSDGVTDNPRTDTNVTTDVNVTAIFTRKTGTITDERDNNSYPWVQIGTQTWMAKNLAYLPSVQGPATGWGTTTIARYAVYGYTADNIVANAKAHPNYQNYGVLYNWSAVMQNNGQGGSNGICPAGWHVPSDDEWTTLTDYLGGLNIAGGKLKGTTTCNGTNHPCWNSPNTGTTNEFGFKAWSNGIRYASGTFNLFGTHATFWSSSATGTMPWYRYLQNKSIAVVRPSDHPTVGLSVRCVKD